MSITVRIRPERGSVEQSFKIIRRLEEAGAGLPPEFFDTVNVID